MKKVIAIMALGILCLSFGASIARADRPVALLSSTGWMIAPDRSATFSDTSLRLEASGTREIASYRDGIADHHGGPVDHYQWVNKFHHGAMFTTPPPQSVPEPSALVLLVCGCLGLAALSRKLASPNLQSAMNRSCFDFSH